MSVSTNKKTIYLKDYIPSAFNITTTELDINLTEAVTTVKSRLQMQRNKSTDSSAALVLYGEHMILKQVKLDGKILGSDEFTQDAHSLTVRNVPSEFTLEIINEIKPQENTALSGLYKSGPMFCTQCEAEGFRRITYYLDRPDVMSTFTVTIHADKKQYPVLLANGNLIAQGDDSETRHFATWQDPFKKPCYLFAMVAGNLLAIEDNFVTMSGRLVKLRLFVEHENLEQTSHAVAAIKKAMAWDEQAYGREYDLDVYMIVAVNDFNMGAMENKGLNIFNSRYVLASVSTATDMDFEHIDSVIAHEYLHNWSGNRVTCRDWFQLSLKEGFTVFREQQFTQYITQSPVCRIENVKLLINRQFAEDAGPLAHPVRPDSYLEINNFYTMTVYEKGAELIRMMLTILGPDKFRKGTDLYFARHDGQAVTTDDFVAALEDASGIDLTQFKLWYEIAGTPEVTVAESYDAKTKTYTLQLKQKTPDTPGQTNKPALYIPIALGLLDHNGKDIPLDKNILAFTQIEQTFEFKNIPVHPKLSILRDFSAPVKLKHTQTAQDQAFLLAHDSDDFNRWYAGQQLFLNTLLDLIIAVQKDAELSLPHIVLESFKEVLLDENLNVSLKAELLCLPSTQQLIDNMEVADPDAIYTAKKFVVSTLTRTLNSELNAMYSKYHLGGQYRFNAHDVGYRSCKNVILGYLASAKDQHAIKLAVHQYHSANNMTDTIAALACIASIHCPQREEILNEFYSKWEDNQLVVNKWLAIQAQADLDNTLQIVQDLTRHQAFELKNPNKVYSLIGAFTVGNPIKFHSATGAGYEFLGDLVVQLNSLNPQIAARMLNPFMQWRRFDQQRQNLMRKQLERIRSVANVSPDVFEITSKALI